MSVPHYFGFTEGGRGVRLKLDDWTSQTVGRLLHVGIADTQYVDPYAAQPDGTGFHSAETVIRPAPAGTAGPNDYRSDQSEAEDD